MLNGTIIKTSGKVQGRTIIERPAAKDKVKPTVWVGEVANQKSPIKKITNRIKANKTNFALNFFSSSVNVLLTILIKFFQIKKIKKIN